MAIEPPSSNVDHVAMNVVENAFVDSVYNPGEAIALLLEKMAAMARDIGGAHRACVTDWNSVLPSLRVADEAELEPMVKRQVLTEGDTWAQEWMLCQMAKHLYERFEYRCLCETPFAEHIESVEYEDDGRVRQWKQRADTAEQL